MFPVIPSEVEGSRRITKGFPTGFFDPAEFILSERSESNGLRSE
jgi:hypothetical protein